MIINHPNLMCTGVPAPKEWEMNGSKGVTYKVELSDGTGTICFTCKDGDVWKMFEPFKPYTVSLDLVQVANEGRMGVRAKVVGAARADKK